MSILQLKVELENVRKEYNSFWDANKIKLDAAADRKRTEAIDIFKGYFEKSGFNVVHHVGSDHSDGRTYRVDNYTAAYGDLNYSISSPEIELPIFGAYGRIQLFETKRNTKVKETNIIIHFVNRSPSSSTPSWELKSPTEESLKNLIKAKKDDLEQSKRWYSKPENLEFTFYVHVAHQQRIPEGDFSKILESFTS